MTIIQLDGGRAVSDQAWLRQSNDQTEVPRGGLQAHRGQPHSCGWASELMSVVGGSRLLVFAALMWSLQDLSCSRAHGADVASVQVAYEHAFLQTDPTPGIEAPFEPYVFRAEARSAATNTIASGSVSNARGTSALTVDPVSAVLRAGFATTSELLAAQPPGTYRFMLETAHDGSRQLALDLGPAAFPEMPHITNADEAQAIPATRPFPVQWDHWSGGTGQDFIGLRVEDLFGNLVLRTPAPGQPDALSGSDSTFTIPAHTLEPASSYVIRLGFLKVTQANMTSYPGVTALAGWESVTTLYVGTSEDKPRIDFGRAWALKGRVFQQTNDLAGLPPAALGYEFVAGVTVETVGVVSSAMVSGPDSNPVTLLDQGDHRTYSVSRPTATAPALDTFAPWGRYDLAVQAVDGTALAASVPLTAAGYPPSPRIANLEAAQVIDGTADFTLTWDALSGPEPGDGLVLAVRDAAGRTWFETPGPAESGLLAGTNDRIQIPSLTLPSGVALTGVLRCLRVELLDTNTIPGAVIYSGTFSETRFPLNVRSDEPPQFSITVTNLTPAVVGEDYECFLTTANGELPARWELLEGTLPKGLELDGAMGVIHGYAITSGSYSFLVQARDQQSRLAARSVTMEVTGAPSQLSVATTALEDAIGESHYLAELEAEGGVPPYRWSLADPSTLPAGLLLQGGTGLISGTPATPGSHSLDCLVTDAAGQSAHAVLTLTVPPLVPATPLLLTNAVSMGDTFRFEALVETNAAYTLEESRDLSHWTPLFVTNAPSNGRILFTVAAGQGAGRSYRARLGAPVAPGNPAKVHVELASNAVASLDYPLLGGTLRLTNQAGQTYTLEIPSNSIRAAVPIRMTLLASASGLPMSGGLLGGVHLEPEGAWLARPARLTVQFTGPVPDGLRCFSYYQRGEGYHGYPYLAVTNAVTCDVLHFSGYGFGTDAGTCEPTQTPCNPADQARQGLAVLLCQKLDMASPEFGAQAEVIFDGWFNQSVLPNAVLAKTDENRLRPAWRDFLSWLKARETLTGTATNVLDWNGDDPQARLAYRALVLGTESAMKKAYERCVEKHDYIAPAKVLELYRDLQTMGGDRFSSFEHWVRKIQECFRFEVHFVSNTEWRSADGAERATVSMESWPRSGNRSLMVPLGILNPEGTNATYDLINTGYRISSPPKSLISYQTEPRKGWFGLTYLKLHWTTKPPPDLPPDGCPVEPPFWDEVDRLEVTACFDYLSPTVVWFCEKGQRTRLQLNQQAWPWQFQVLHQQEWIPYDSPARPYFGNSESLFVFRPDAWEQQPPGQALVARSRMSREVNTDMGLVKGNTLIELYHKPKCASCRR